MNKNRSVRIVLSGSSTQSLYKLGLSESEAHFTVAAGGNGRMRENNKNMLGLEAPPDDRAWRNLSRNEYYDTRDDRRAAAAGRTPCQ